MGEKELREKEKKKHSGLMRYSWATNPFAPRSRLPAAKAQLNTWCAPCVNGVRSFVRSSSPSILFSIYIIIIWRRNAHYIPNKQRNSCMQSSIHNLLDCWAARCCWEESINLLKGCRQRSLFPFDGVPTNFPSDTPIVSPSHPLMAGCPTRDAETK